MLIYYNTERTTTLIIPALCLITLEQLLKSILYYKQEYETRIELYLTVCAVYKGES